MFIFGTIYVDSPMKAEFMQMWIELNQKLNPEFDLLVIDSKSDRVWFNLIPGIKDIPIHVVPDGDPMPPLERGLNWIDFPDNMGHHNQNGVDGWGRAFCRGIEYAIQHDYEYVINIECDMFFGKPAMPVLNQMDKHQLNFVSTGLKYSPFPDYFMENTIMFMRTSFMRDVDFIKKYDWRKDWTKAGRAWDIPERRMETILGEEIFYKPWDGVRGHGGHAALKNTSDVQYLDYIMHAEHTKLHPQPMELYYAFMRKYMGQDWIPPSQRQ